MLTLPTNYKINEYEIILSWDCNQSCLYCYESKCRGDKKQTGTFSDINTSKLIDFIRDTHDENSPQLSFIFFGGEPLLYFEKIKEITEKLKKIFSAKEKIPVLNFSISTNLTMSDNNQFDYLLANNFSFLVSLDGKQDSHEKNRGHDTFYEVLNRLSYLYAKKAMVELRATIANNTIDKFVENFNFLNSLGFSFFWQFDTSKKYELAQLEKFYNDLLSLYLTHWPINDITISQFLSRKMKKAYCIDPHKTISIGPQGELFICSRISEKIGDFEKGIFDYSLLQDLPIYGFTKHPICANCLSYEYCQGGCLAQHFEISKDEGMKYVPNDTFCKIQNLIHMVILKMKLITNKC